MQYRTAPLVSYLVILVALVALVLSPQTQGAGSSNSAFLDSYFAGEDVSAYKAEMLATVGEHLQVDRTTAPAALAKAFETFLPKLQEALAEDHSSLLLLKSEYEYLKAHHLLFLAHLDQVENRLSETKAPVEGFKRRHLFAEDYQKRTESLFLSLDAFYSQFARVADSSSSVWEKLQAIVGNFYDAFRLESYAEAIRALSQPPERMILRTNGLPYGTLNLPARTPVTTPVIEPSYANGKHSSPDTADLKGTEEAPLSDAILALAAKLEYDPVAVYRYVSDNIRTEWYAGSMKGAEKTLEQAAGNDVDQASLLIALLRASGIPARYVHGVVEYSTDALRQEFGIEDPSEIVRAIRSAGVPVKSVIRGGGINAVQVEHTWVAAYVPYTNYRGATVDRTGKVWLPLDPSTKTIARVAANGVLGQVEDRLESLIADYFESVQALDPLERTRTLVNEHVAGLDLDLASQLGSSKIIQGDLNYLPNSLQIPVVAVTKEEPVLGEAYRQYIRLKVYSSTNPAASAVLETTLPASALVGERVTLSYIPATADDQNIVNSFGGMDAVPPYLVTLRPQFKVAGRTVGVAQKSVAMADWLRLELTLMMPGHSETVSKNVLSGGYEAIGIGAQTMQDTRDRVLVGDTESTAARLLSQAALRYIKAWDVAENELATLAAHTIIRPLPTVVFVGSELTVDSVLGQPQLINWKGVSIDAAFRTMAAIPQHAASLPAQTLYRLSSLQGSFLEHSHFERDFFVQSISADKGLAVAREQGIPVVELAATNFEQVSELAHPQNVRDDIQDWLARGYKVQVPVSEISYQQWQGSVWVVTDHASGAQGYFLSGGLAGGQTASTEWPTELRQALEYEYTIAASRAEGVYRIEKILRTDGQVGKAGQPGEELVVRAVSKKGRPVQGVPIVFKRTLGGIVFSEDVPGQGTDPAVDQDSNANESEYPDEGAPEEEPKEASVITVYTDKLGFAKASFTHGEDTSVSSIYFNVDPTKQYADRVSISVVQAIHDNGAEQIQLDEPFSIITGPDAPVELVLTNDTGLSRWPGAWATTLLVKVVDQYENPVSNIDVTAAVAASTPGMHADSLAAKVAVSGQCEIAALNIWNCGTDSHTTKTSPGLGAAFYLLNGNESGITYRWRITGADDEEIVSTHVASPKDKEEAISYTVLIDGDGNLVTTAKIGEFHAEKMYFSAQRYRRTQEVDTGFQYSVEPLPFIEGPTLAVRDSGSGSLGQAADLYSYAPGKYHFRASVGDIPGLYSVWLTGAIPDESQESGRKSIAEIVGRIIGVQPIVESISSGEGSPAPNAAVISPDGLSRFDLAITNKILPEGYNPLVRDVLIFEDDKPIYQTFKNTEDVVSLPAGVEFNMEKSYSAKLFLHYGSSLEIASDPFPLPLHQEIVISPRKGAAIAAAREVDVMNQWICDMNARFYFELSHQATLDVKLIDPRSEQEIILAAGAVYGTGEQSLAIPMSDLSPGIYRYHMKAVSSQDGHAEEREGLLRVDVRSASQLPVGHVIEHDVDLFDGHLVFSRTDFRVDSRGPDLELQRFYSSSNNEKGSPFGPGWSHNLQSYIRDSGCGSMTIAGGQGGGRYFLEKDGTYRPQKGLHGTLQKLTDDNDNVRWVFTAKDGTAYGYTKHQFDDAGTWHLDYIIDPNGNALTFAYDPSATPAKLMAVKDQAGRTLSFHYRKIVDGIIGGDEEVISRIEAPNGLVYTYDYDQYGRLIQASKEGADGGSIVELYTYDKPEDIESAYYHRFANLRSITDPNGNLTQYLYDLLPIKVVSGSVSLTIPTAAVTKITRQRAGKHHDIVFEYPSRDDRSQPLMASVNEGQGRKRTYTMNQYGSPTRIVGPAGTVTMEWASDDILMLSRTDERDVETTYFYDEHGNVLKEIVGDLPPVIYTYKAFPEGLIKNRVATRTGRNGVTTKYEYDASGNVVEVKVGDYIESFNYAKNGDKLTHIDRNQNQTHFKYDTYGYVTEVARPESVTEQAVWSVLGLQIESVNGNGAKTQFVYDDLGRLMSIIDAEGGERSYTYDALGNKLSETDPEKRVTRWTYNESNQPTQIENPLSSKSMEYDVFGNLVKESDWQGNWTSYEYDDANRQIAVRYPGDSERFVQRAYDGAGNILREESNLGRFETYEYDALSRLVKITDALGNAREIVYDDEAKTKTEKDKLDRSTVTYFDDLGRVTRVEEPGGRITHNKYDGNGNLIETFNPIGTKTIATYDGLNRKLMEKVSGTAGLLTEQHYTYDKAGNIVEHINGRLIVTTNTYDALNRLIKKRFADQAFTYSYDGVGNVVEEVLPNGNKIARTFDALNRLETQSDQLGQLEERDYDLNGNLIRSVDANGAVTRYEYDALNQLVVERQPEQRVIEYGYDALGNRISVTLSGPEGSSTTEYGYDVLNRLETEQDALEHRVVYEYDAENNLLSVTNKRGHQTTHTYNDLNQKVLTQDPIGTLTYAYDKVGNLTSQKDRKGIEIQHQYDGLNRLIETRRDGRRILTREYDAEGNLLTETDANGHPTVYVYDDANRVLIVSRPESSVSRYTYDPMGNRLTELDPESRKTTWTYDLRNRVTSETNPKAEITTYEYDANGNRTRLVKPEGNAWRYEYDSANRLVTVIDPANETTHYTYNYQDQRVSHTDALNQTTTYQYDVLGRPTAVVYSDGKRVSYNRYDGNGNLEQMTDANGNGVTYAYDPVDREISRTFQSVAPVANEVLSVTRSYDLNNNITSVVETFSGGLTRSTTSLYDNFDRLIRHTDGFGKTSQYQYDPNGNRTALTDPDHTTTRYTYDGLNRVTTVSNLQGTTAYSYERTGRVLEVRYPNNAQMRYRYDAAGRVESISHRQNAAPVSHYAYAYDQNGNRTRQEETNGRGLEVTTYDYDHLDRLTQVSYPDVPVGSATTVIYGYDAVYNRTGETVLDASGTTVKDLGYQYNNRNQLIQVQDNLDPSQSITYHFDANGNQTGKTQAGVTTTFVYDVRDHLRQVTQGGSTVGQFLYDHRGLRVEKQGARGTERYSYDDTSVLTQFDASGATLAKYEYGGDRLLSLNHFGDGVQFYHFDALGSPVTLTKPDGTVQARYAYDAWGHVRHQSGTSWNRFGFTGHEHDQETGLIYAKARYYDPDTGRFLSHDPWEGDITLAPSLNKYLYAYMNPTVYIDPDGREAVVAPRGGHPLLLLGNLSGQNLIAAQEARMDLYQRLVGTSPSAQASFDQPALAVEHSSKAGVEKVALAPESASKVAYLYRAIEENQRRRDQYAAEGTSPRLVAMFDQHIAQDLAQLQKMQGITVDPGAGTYVRPAESSRQLGDGKLVNPQATPLDNDTGGSEIVDIGTSSSTTPIVENGGWSTSYPAGTVSLPNTMLSESNECVYCVAKEIPISRAKYGEAADHIADAQKAGHPDVLTVARDGASANRNASIGGLPKVAGKQLDEYPPAMFKEGGAGASVRAINPRDNMAAGACIGNACRGLANGEKVRIKVVD